jgi:hypothetical protein
MTVYEVGISEATGLKMLHENLGMSKVSTRLIPKLLNLEQKLCRQHICQEHLGASADNEELSWKIIAGDETWVISLGFTDQTRIHAEVHKETIRKLKTATQHKRAHNCASEDYAAS